jgi:uncharacterized RDD family membrane protein YckC
MKTVSHPKYFVLLLLVLGLGLAPLVRAQEKAPAAPTAPGEPAATEQSADAKPDEAPATEATPAEENKEAIVTESESADETPAKPNKAKRKQRWDGSRSDRSNERVSYGGNSTLAEGEQAEAVVSIMGSSTSAGDVSDAVVSVAGSSRVTGGTVGDSVVSVMGNTYVNAHVRGEVVAVLGNVELGPNAVVDGEVVCIGGVITRDPNAVIKGNVQNIAVAGQQFDFEGLTTWFTKCLMYGRPLAFDSRLIWAWCIGFAFLAFYALIALIAPRGVVKCAETLEQRPGSSLITAILMLVLTPVAYVLLVFTIALGGLGIVLIPIFSLGLFVASIFGKVVMLGWLGRRLTKLLGDGPLTHPVVGVLLGGLIVLLLYTIPILGFVLYKLLGILGLGVVVYTLILQYQTAKAARPAPAPKAAPVAVAATPVPGEEGLPPLVAPVASAAPLVISAATLPRVGFWLRLGASFLDFILVSIVIGMLSKVFHGWFAPGGSVPFWFAVYCVVMWATKGTTIGGIICGLKVVRLDDRPIDWGVAIVRALGGFLSLAVAGLGFIWVSFDDDRQSWHDKIAGTTVVKVPKGTPLM